LIIPFLALSSLVIAALVFVIIQNPANVTIGLFGQQISLSLGIAIAIGFAFGNLEMFLCLFPFLNRAKANNNIQSEWGKQDVKLASQIKSDREKQLESKIETLEAALKSALNRNK
jgi:uncharacterized integral membrane protein